MKQKDISGFEFSKNNKRYYTQDYFLKNKFGTKVCKIPLNAGYSCPNIDGSVGFGGCIYCSSNGSGDFAGNPEDTLKKQFDEIKINMNKKWKTTKYIAYFQAHSNTYGSLEKLKKITNEVLNFDGVVGISIATRADCLNDDIVKYLYNLAKKTYLIIELGLQTIHDKTAEKINRCHSYKQFLNGYNLLKNQNLNVGVHIINGLPGETNEMMLETARTVSNLNPHSIKIHLLHVLKNTKLAQMFENKEFDVLTQDQYVTIVCNQLQIINKNIIIERLTGDGKKDDLIAPLWSLKKFCVLNDIDKEMKTRQAYQGDKN
ncbi:MAG: TIGR01212 family radical SAM protein [Oscillospiraceae bacterium]